MRIIHVTREQESDRRYGLGKSLLPVVEALRNRGHYVRYACQSDLTDAEHRKMEGRRAWLSSLLSRLHPRFGHIGLIAGAAVERISMGYCAARIAREENATHVHCHDPWIAAGLCRAIGTDQSLSWGITEHGFGSYANAHKDEGIQIGRRLLLLLHAWERRTLAKADWVIVPTDSCRYQLARDLGIFGPQAHWHAVPHAKPALNLYERTAARSQLGWEENTRHIVAVGRFALMKNFPLLIEACAHVANFDGIDIRLTILGEGDPGPLLAAAAAYGFTDRLTLGITDDIGLYLSAADLYVSASSTESFGMANLEAMIAGLPVVCVAGGATADVIGCGGWLIPENKDCLIEAIHTLLTNREVQILWRQLAQDRGGHWPNPANIADRYAEIYTSAIRHHP